MANTVISRVQWIEDDPFGYFDQGDLLEVYLDTSLIPLGGAFQITTGITAKLNGASYTTNSYYYDDPTIVQRTNYVINVCFGTSFVFNESYPVYPFSFYTVYPDWPACAVTPVTCDLMVTGDPLVTRPTTETSDDGSITISATSTRVIQYKLNEDFIYGTGQASNVFTGLIQGNYRIYLRDELNCRQNILVKVKYIPVYGTYYRYEYNDIYGGLTTIDINKRDYTGAVTEIIGGENGIKLMLRGEGETDKFTPMLAGQADIDLVSETDQYFIDLYTNDRDLYQVNYYKDSVLKWRGKLLPFRYEEEYKAPPYFVTITATDGLPELTELYLITGDGLKYQGKEKLIKVLANCLKQLGLELPIKVAINLYSTIMDQTDADDPLDQAYLDYEVFYINEGQPTLDYVVRNILKPFNARLIQWDGYWNIVRVEELGGSYDYRVFDVDGDYVSESSYNPVLDVNYPDQNGIMFTSFPSLELRPGYGQIKMIYNLGLKNIIKNGDFSLISSFNGARYVYEINRDGFVLANADYPIVEGYEFISKSTVAYNIIGGSDLITNSSAGDAYLKTEPVNIAMNVNNTLKITLRYKIATATSVLDSIPYHINIPYTKVRVKVKWTAYNMWLQPDGSWQNIESTVDIFADKVDEYIETELTARQPTTFGTPLTGMDLEISIYHAYPFYAQNHTLAELRAIQTWDGSNFLLPVGYRTELRTTFSGNDSFFYYKLEDSADVDNPNFQVRPTDYNGLMWIYHTFSVVPATVGENLFSFCIDYIRLDLLTNGDAQPDTIIDLINAEPKNKNILEEVVILGSGSANIETETDFSIQTGVYFPNPIPGLNIDQYSVPSYKTIYTGWLRTSADASHEFWTRDGFTEAQKLHEISLKTIGSNYSRSWRLLRGTVTSRDSLFGFLNTIKEVNDDNRLYIPISMTIDDRMCQYGGEFLELLRAADGGPLTGGAFTSAFSTAFNI